MTADTYRILMVCTGNICRSPLMERLFVARLYAGLPATDAARFHVSSAGTWGMSGSPMSPESAKTLIALGGDPTGFVARDLDADMLDESDLILTATDEHREIVVTAVLATDPLASDRVFTLREFARLLDGVTAHDVDERVSGGDPVERMRAITALALARRGSTAADVNDSSDDVPDPYHRDRSAYLLAATLIDEALAVPLALLLA